MTADRLKVVAIMLCAVLAKTYLGEAVTPVRWIGAPVITLGVVIVGLGDVSSTLHKP